jgi:hypothetical protein
MILTATILVSDGGPPKEPAEIVEVYRLNLSGDWEGTWWVDKGKRFSMVSVGSDLFASRRNAHTLIDTKGILDDGHGRFHGTWLFAEHGIHGIYKWEGKWLFICFSRRPDPPPTSFTATDSHCLLILHRVKPRK